MFRAHPPRIKLWSDMNGKFLEEQIDLRQNADDWLKAIGFRLRTDESRPAVVSLAMARSVNGRNMPPPKVTPSVNPHTGQGDQTSNLGPSFDCQSKVVSNQPLAQIICGNKELSRFELAYVISYQALRESLGGEDRKVLANEAQHFVIALNDQCQIPRTGALQARPTGIEIHCIKVLFQQQRQKLIERTTGVAREEAILEPTEAISIQRGLQAKRHLAWDAKVDAIFGPVTRNAISSWQRAEGLAETGFGSKSMLPILASPSRVRLPPDKSIESGPRGPDELREIQMVRTGGTYGVPVQINDTVALNFILDSGASDVSIPFDVFSTLVRAGTIGRDDIIGTQAYLLADGSKKTAVTFNIRSLRVGTVVLTNVRGSVAEDAAPLLLGMSFLSRFQSWSVDNARHVLVLR